MTETIGAGVRRSPTPPREPTPAELHAFLNARRENDRAIRQRLVEDERLKFTQALRVNHQPQLLSSTPTEGSLRPPQLKSRTNPLPSPFQAPQRPSGEGSVQSAVVQAAITATLRQVDTPEWYVSLVLPHAEARLAARLLEQACAKAEAAGRTLRVSIVRADRIKRDLRIYRLLALAAFAYLDASGHRRGMRHANSATYFTVLDALPAITGLASSTCEAALADLRACDLLATLRVYQGATFTTGEGDAAKQVTMKAVTGVWACVNLQPQHPTHRPMILRSELPAAAPRDLQADRKAGRTAWQLRAEREVGESLPCETGSETYQDLLGWALSNFKQTPSVKSDSPTSDGWAWNEMDEVRRAVEAVRREHPQRRGEAVASAAQLIGRVLNDTNGVSHRSYCRMLWRGLEGELQQRPALAGLLDAIDRTLVYRRESGQDTRPLRAPGAYLRSVLAESGWLEREYRRVV